VLERAGQDRDDAAQRAQAEAGPGRNRVPGDPRPVGADTRTVKAWAGANGYQVRDSGRVPNQILAAFGAAN